MSEKEPSTLSKAFLEGLGLTKGIVVGTTKSGHAQTIILNANIYDLALYTKLIDGHIREQLEKGVTIDNRDSRTDGIGEVSGSGDSGEKI